MSGTDLPLVIETDCSSVAKVLEPSCIDRSEIGATAKEFQTTRQENREVKVCKVDKRDNSAHSLAQFGRRELRGGVMQGIVLTCMLSMTFRDCKNNIFSF